MHLDAIRNALGDGLLSFPVTDFDDNGDFNQAGFTSRLEWFVTYDISAVFVAGGTGEFFSLSREEYRRIVHVAADVVNGRVPVISSLGRSIPEAIDFARIAGEAGIDGLLLMPPYLASGPPEGVVAYAREIMNSTDLPVIYYNRANGNLSADGIAALARACQNLIGLKDGVGDIQELNATIKTIGDRLVYIGGVPTAEIISEAYLSIGVNTYSSAVFNFVPDLATCYYQALRAGDHEVVRRILREFYIPFVRLRSRKPGYAVSLIKEGAKLTGRSAGNVRAPLVMPDTDESRQLQSLIDRAQELSMAVGH